MDRDYDGRPPLQPRRSNVWSGPADIFDQWGVRPIIARHFDIELGTLPGVTKGETSISSQRQRTGERIGIALVVASYLLIPIWPHFDILSGTCWPAVVVASLLLGIVGFFLSLRFMPHGLPRTSCMVAGALMTLSLVKSVFWTATGPFGRCVAFYIDVPFVG